MQDRWINTFRTSRALGIYAVRPNAYFFKLGVREESDWQRIVLKTTAQFGPLGAVVNDTAITGFESDGSRHDSEHGDLSSWYVHATNLASVFLVRKYTTHAMRPLKQGSIIDISPHSGVVGISAALACTHSKAAVRNHTKSVALYCAEQCLHIFGLSGGSVQRGCNLFILGCMSSLYFFIGVMLD